MTSNNQIIAKCDFFSNVTVPYLRGLPVGSDEKEVVLKAHLEWCNALIGVLIEEGADSENPELVALRKNQRVCQIALKPIQPNS